MLFSEMCDVRNMQNTATDCVDKTNSYFRYTRYQAAYIAQLFSLHPVSGCIHCTVIFVTPGIRLRTLHSYFRYTQYQAAYIAPVGATVIYRRLTQLPYAFQPYIDDSSTLCHSST